VLPHEADGFVRKQKLDSSGSNNLIFREGVTGIQVCGYKFHTLDVSSLHPFQDLCLPSREFGLCTREKDMRTELHVLQFNPTPPPNCIYVDNPPPQHRPPACRWKKHKQKQETKKKKGKRKTGELGFD